MRTLFVMAALSVALGGCVASDSGALFTNRIVVEREAGLLDANVAVVIDTMSYELGFNEFGEPVWLRKILAVSTSDSTIQQLSATAASAVHQAIRGPDTSETVVNNGSASLSAAEGGDADALALSAAAAKSAAGAVSAPNVRTTTTNINTALGGSGGRGGAGGDGGDGGDGGGNGPPDNRPPPKPPKPPWGGGH